MHRKGDVPKLSGRADGCSLQGRFRIGAVRNDMEFNEDHRGVDGVTARIPHLKDEVRRHTTSFLFRNGQQCLWAFVVTIGRGDREVLWLKRVLKHRLTWKDGDTRLHHRANADESRRRLKNSRCSDATAVMQDWCTLRKAAEESVIAPEGVFAHTRGRFVHLTDSVQLRWIQLNCAVDTSEASASAHTITPPPAATPVR